ncbi:MAG TPA: tetratricopeptide repeat protein [Sphingomicrobium sp.]|nr:tetratricopeptide repeat protein [Sphingomicrobium sp.]
MSRSLRFGSAASAIVLASMIAGCAAPQEKLGLSSRANENVGLATRALMALNAKNLPVAIDYAEKAVEHSPDDAGFRALLGNAYFAAGRFSSAEAAYKDALTIYSNQPQVVLRLALVETALGKKDQAVAFLHAGQSVLDASNYGLALAVAGEHDEAIEVLDSAARQPGADATVRQNLALAHALAGDWTEARTIAAQDVPGDKLDARIRDWMQLASPKKPSDQVAALTGVTPSAVDQGQPVRLALRKTDTMLAQAAPAPAPVAQATPAPAPQVAQAAPPPPPAPQPAPTFAEAVAAPTPAPQPAPAVAPAPSVAKALVSEAASIATQTTTMLATAAHKAEATVAAFMPNRAPPAAKPKARHIAAAVHHGNSGVVMQVASYRSPQQVSAGWSNLTQRFPALRAYLPLRARFDSPKGTFWRLSIQGFGNEREAIARCNLLKSRGGRCFVRGAAGDAPVEIASR